MILYLVLAGAYLASSGAPSRVHLLALACLALAILPTTFLMAAGKASHHHWAAVITCIAAAMFAWDGLSWIVITKMEPFIIARYSPGIYAVGLACVLAVVVLAARCQHWVSGRTGRRDRPR